YRLPRVRLRGIGHRGVREECRDQARRRPGGGEDETVHPGMMEVRQRRHGRSAAQRQALYNARVITPWCFSRRCSFRRCCSPRYQKTPVWLTYTALSEVENIKVSSVVSML